MTVYTTCRATQLFRFSRFNGDFRAFLSWCYDQKFPSQFINYLIGAWDSYHCEKELSEKELQHVRIIKHCRRKAKSRV